MAARWTILRISAAAGVGLSRSSSATARCGTMKPVEHQQSSRNNKAAREDFAVAETPTDREVKVAKSSRYENPIQTSAGAAWAKASAPDMTRSAVTIARKTGTRTSTGAKPPK